MQNNSENKNIGDKINDFVQRNRKGIFVSLCVLIVLLAGTVIYLALNDYLQKKAIAEVEEISRKFLDLHLDHDHDDSVEHEYTDPLSAEVDAVLEELNLFVKNKSGVAAARAWSLIGQINTRRKDWPQVENAWRSAARAGAKTYLAPVAFFNAAAAAEEQGKLEEAIELYGNCVSHKFEFAASPRAQFAIGRLNEKLDNVPAAIEAYRLVLIKWPNITAWTNLAHSRIAALDVQ